MSDLVNEMYQQQIDSLQSSLYTLEDELGRIRNYVVKCKAVIRNLADGVQLSDNWDMEPLDIEQIRRNVSSYGLNNIKQQQDEAEELQNEQQRNLKQLSINLDMLGQKLQEYKLFNKANDQRVQQLIGGIQGSVKGTQIVQKGSNDNLLSYQQQIQAYLEKICTQEQVIAQKNARIIDLESENAALAAKSEANRLELQRMEHKLQGLQEHEKQMQEQLLQYQQVQIQYQTEKLSSVKNADKVEIIDDDTVWYYKKKIQDLKQVNDEQQQVQESILETLNVLSNQLEYVKTWSITQLQELRKDFTSHTVGYYTLRDSVMSKLDMTDFNINKLNETYILLTDTLQQGWADLQGHQNSYDKYAQQLQDILASLHMIAMAFVIQGGLESKHLRKLVNRYQAYTSKPYEFTKAENNDQTENNGTVETQAGTLQPDSEMDEINEKLHKNRGSTWLQRHIYHLYQNRIDEYEKSAKEADHKAQLQELQIEDLQRLLTQLHAKVDIYEEELASVRNNYEQKFLEFKKSAVKAINSLVQRQHLFQQ